MIRDAQKWMDQNIPDPILGLGYREPGTSWLAIWELGDFEDVENIRPLFKAVGIRCFFHPN